MIATSCCKHMWPSSLPVHADRDAYREEQHHRCRERRLRHCCALLLAAGPLPGGVAGAQLRPLRQRAAGRPVLGTGHQPLRAAAACQLHCCITEQQQPSAVFADSTHYGRVIEGQSTARDPKQEVRATCCTAHPNERRIGHCRYSHLSLYNSKPDAGRSCRRYSAPVLLGCVGTAMPSVLSAAPRRAAMLC